jgi:hypothetical protein
MAGGLPPSQTVGPYFAYALTPDGKHDWNDAFTSGLATTRTDATSARIRIRGVKYSTLTAPQFPIVCWRYGRLTARVDSRRALG